MIDFILMFQVFSFSDISVSIQKCVLRHQYTVLSIILIAIKMTPPLLKCKLWYDLKYFQSNTSDIGNRMVLNCNNTDTLSKGRTLIRILMNENEIFVENNELPSSKEALHPSGTFQSKLTLSIFKSFSIETTYLVFWSHVINVCKIKIDKYRPCDSRSPLFTFEI